jgi:hypothetical protein
MICIFTALFAARTTPADRSVRLSLATLEGRDCPAAGIGRAVLTSPVVQVSINPQPLPPGRAVGINPQPLPPGIAAGINPQPLPPGIIWVG